MLEQGYSSLRRCRVVAIQELGNPGGDPGRAREVNLVGQVFAYDDHFWGAEEHVDASLGYEGTADFISSFTH
jgi:hypothetical protein